MVSMELSQTLLTKKAGQDRAASSAKNISLFNTFRTFVLNRKRAWLNNLLSLILWRYTPSSDRLKAWESSREKKIPKSAGASTHPLFHPAFEWEWVLGGAIVLDDTLHIFMKSFDHLQELGGACYSLQHGKESSPANQVNFSCSCLSEKIMTILDLSALNLHCASGYMRSASNCNLLRTTRARTFPTRLRRDIPR